eukprot:157871_1
MGNTDSTERLGARVLSGKTKLQQDIETQSKRYEYLKENSPETLNSMLKSVAGSFESCSPFLEPTLLIAWMYDSEQCEKVVLDSCRKVLNAPIKRME